MDMGLQFFIAFFEAVKAGYCTEDRKMRCPCMCRNDMASGDISRTILRSSFASSPSMGLPSECRLPICLSLALIFSATEKPGQGQRCGSFWFCHFFIDAADFSRKHERTSESAGLWHILCSKSFFEAEKSMTRRFKFILKFLEPLGCVKSPEPTTEIPFSWAHFQRFSGLRSLLVAREYFEWICRSAIKRMQDYSMKLILQDEGMSGD